VDIDGRLTESRAQLERVSASQYLKELEGTIGADPFCGAADLRTGSPESNLRAS
jgi:hypothetical protein